MAKFPVTNVKEQQLLLPKKPGKLTLAFGSESKDSDAVLVGPKIPYLLTVEVAMNHPERKWLEGYRALSKAYLPDTHNGRNYASRHFQTEW